VHLAGLAWDGSSLWCGSQNDGRLYALDVSEERVMKAFGTAAPLGGLAWDGHHLWVGAATGLKWNGESWVGEALVANLLLGLDPEDGQVVRRHVLSYWPMGLAWDGSHLWISDSQNAKLHRLAL
jgi:hypothetical protein